MTENKKLAVAEAFYSLQGEGQTMGRPSVFIRLAGCNLMCGGQGTQKDGKLHNGATWRCDTIEVWLKGKKKSHAELVNELDIKFDFIIRLKLGAHLIITGGEPMLQQEAIIDFLYYLETTYRVNPYTEIETNGTVEPLKDLIDIVDLFNVSPKLSNSGEPYEKRIHPEVLFKFVKLVSQFKFVISDLHDISETHSIIKKIKIPNHMVWFMPAASTKQELEDIQNSVAQYAVVNHYNYSNRLHIQIWNQKTGV
jgi:organic radical activating enzyme